jgi:hypothetical protein
VDIKNVLENRLVRELSDFYKTTDKSYSIEIYGPGLVDLFVIGEVNYPLSVCLVGFGSSRSVPDDFIAFIFDKYECDITSIDYKIFCYDKNGKLPLFEVCLDGGDVFSSREGVFSSFCLSSDCLGHTIGSGTVYGPAIDTFSSGILSPYGPFKEEVLSKPSCVIRAVRQSVQHDLDLSFHFYGILKRVLDNYREKRILKARLRGKDCDADVLPEFEQLLMLDDPSPAIRKLKNIGILQLYLPIIVDLEEVRQDKSLSRNVFHHTLRVLRFCPPEIVLRWSALFHDVGKIETRYYNKRSGDVSYHGHDAVGSEIAHRVLGQIGVLGEKRNMICHVVRNHMILGGLILNMNRNLTEKAIKRFYCKAREYQRHVLLLCLADRLANMRQEDRLDLSLQPFYEMYSKFDEIDKSKID